MKINWKVRVKNKMFWLSIVPALLILVQTIAAPFGYKFDFGVLNQQLANIINAVFVVLSILGIVVDPTTHGVNDSTNALNYDQPKKEDE
ncbi:phage holin [Enterococcus cecorum]|uniref:phage holin n=1 Tax=Enterococcus cecorum TaxID=44008 RepID=UPI001FACC0DB|nr:phage holin [Enterococcus cecorum]MCJ0572904.1 phage holin [Enterococcus cecorum]MCJ0590884.1 phage holin [Enterococcus cecorum]